MNAISVSHLSKQYTLGPLALDDISINIESGDFYGLLGANGAGKSTLISILSGLSDPSSGNFSVYGHSHTTDRNTIKSLIGLVPQEYNCNIFERVIDIVVQQGGYFGVPRDIAIKRAEKILTDLSLDDKMYVPSKNLSGGMKRRLMIARALIHEPKILILDEPTAGVDVELRQGMWEYLKTLNEQGTTILLTTHYLEEAEELCNRIGIIAKGKCLHQGSKKELLSQMQEVSYIAEGQFPESFFSACHAKQINEHTVSIQVNRQTPLSELMAKWHELGAVVTDIRPSSSRLEQLFVSIKNT